MIEGMNTTPPPYTITPVILDLSIRIGEAIGRAEARAVNENLRLRRINRIRTIQGSLAIEGNTLTEDEITTILEGRPVIAPPREIQEVRNAFGAYDMFPQWNPASEADLLRAHEMLMVGCSTLPAATDVSASPWAEEEKYTTSVRLLTEYPTSWRICCHGWAVPPSIR